MRLTHFEQLRPICPVCGLAGRDPSPVRLIHAERSTASEILDGALACSAPRCRVEYPIIDGLPILVPNPREVIARQLAALRDRDDLSPYVETFFADSAPGSEYERARQHFGQYAHLHWGDLAEPGLAGRGAAGVIARAMSLLASPPRGTWLDVGCSAARGAVELARAGAELVLGVDLDLGTLRRVRAALATGRLAYDLRRVGAVYERRVVELGGSPDVVERVDLWACDATALPLPAGAVAGAIGLNVLDVVDDPIGHLAEIGRVVAPGGDVLLSTPFDWALVTTPFERWIGGHTQRAPHGGSSEQELDRILGDGDPHGLGLRGVANAEAEWSIHMHGRAEMRYRLHVVAATRA